MDRTRLAEPLTPAERRVLDLLPTHLTDARMAEQLFVSRNTVKSHVKSLYRKLEVSSRADAVARAREMGLLSAGLTRLRSRRQTMASTAASVCPSCGAGSPEGARFCPACGARLSQPAALPEERKTVTTLFCDLVGFTAMGEQADPEDVDACLRTFGALAREVIERYGGSVEKFIGDAVVGVFGVPVVHEDDPERAVRAALRLVEGLDELRWPDGTPFQARAGIMTGELLVAHDVDPAHGSGFVAGDAINTSARLEASAAPGTVVVGDLTQRLTEQVIRYRPLTPVSVRGKSRPLRRWLALHPVARLGRDATGGRLSALVGRDSEFALLVSLLRKVVDTRTPRVSLIVGDPGIGKTRLVRELFTIVDTGSEFITWRHGRCVPYGEDRTFWALREVVQAHAGILDTHDPEMAAALLERVVEDGPDHRHICERLRPLVGLDAPEADPEENYAAWLRFLQQIATRRPVVLVLEDLHWADEALLAFVDYVAVHAADLPLLLVGTARPALFEQHPAFAASGGRVTRIWLDRLSDDETRTLVSALPEMTGRDAPRSMSSRGERRAIRSSPRSSPGCLPTAVARPPGRCLSPSTR